MAEQQHGNGFARTFAQIAGGVGIVLITAAAGFTFNTYRGIGELTIKIEVLERDKQQMELRIRALEIDIARIQERQQRTR